tara:strand:+ start:7613 stop:8377 length:765 start_codon:yes stop_codon:yes gene_type:complete
MSLIEQPLKVTKLLLKFMETLSSGSLVAHWTNHGIERANLEEREVPEGTIEAANHRRPIVIDTRGNFQWFFSADKDGNPSIAVKDELYGAFYLCYNFGWGAARNSRWVIKTCMHEGAFNRHYGKSDLASVTSRLIEAVSINFVQLDAQVEQTSESEEALLSPEWEIKEVQFPLGWELQDIEEGEDTTSPNQEAREFASFQLKQLPRKTLLNLRKVLGITGNGTGQRGAVSTEHALESILLHMDEKGDYALTFDA